MKPHIYRWNGKWYCQRKYGEFLFRRQLGIAANSPVEAYRRSADYWKWK